MGFLSALGFSKKKTDRKYYLVDLENVGPDVAKCVNDVADGDVFVVFYSEKTKNISMESMEFIASKKVTMESIKAIVGTKNALDFQLSSYLGYLIRDDLDAKFYIVSNDKGYDCLCGYWKDNGIDVNRISAKAQVAKNVQAKSLPAKKSKTPTRLTATRAEIEKYLTPDDNIDAVLAIFNTSKNKSEINVGLTKKFKDSRKAGDIYKRLKPLMVEKGKH